jgi:hypothetical protein
MTRQQSTTIWARGVLLALIALAAAPVAAEAAGICFQNDTNIAIVVQGETVVNGMLRRGQPLLIQPRKMAWDANVPNGTRRVTIYDANQPTRVLGWFLIRCEGDDKAFTVLMVPVPPGAPPKVDIKPIPVP